MAGQVSVIAADWLLKEGQQMGAEGTPRHPALIGGAGLVGTNLLVLLAANPKCEELVVVDAREPSALVLSQAGIEKKVRFVKHLLGTDSEEALAAAIGGCDCVFLMVTPHVQFAPEQAFYKTNVDGVKALIRACEVCAVPRLVYLSSIAATNHFVASVDQKETDPLPLMGTYHSPYDITKRLGEEMVLAANSERLATCALRPASILLSPGDFTLGNILGGIAGLDLIPDPYGMKMVDFIDGRDVSRALVLASQALQTRSKDVGGEAFFVSKGLGPGLTPQGVGRLCQQNMGWWSLPIPAVMVHIVAQSARIGYMLRKALGLQVPGIPPHRFIQMAFSTQTFDNTKARQKLGFEPKISTAEAVARICDIKKLERAAQKGQTSRPFSVGVLVVVIAVVLLVGSKSRKKM